MRTRDWRRFQEEKIFRRRIKQFCRRWYYFHTANGDKIKNPMWVDFIGLPDYNFYKTGTTKNYDTKRKVKYSPNNLNISRRSSKLDRSSKNKISSTIPISSQHALNAQIVLRNKCKRLQDVITIETFFPRYDISITTIQLISKILSYLLQQNSVSGNHTQSA